tara:strand:- start:92289 stop:93092 length:804 start_codon:yes stop_codon:yes gene_type:complete
LQSQTYEDLSFEALNTPKEDWRELFNFMSRMGLKTLFDAGAGNALSAQVAQSEYPSLCVHAHEIVSERLSSLDLPNQVLKICDLMQEPIPICDLTFLYLPTGPLLERILLQLPDNALIAAVESHGDLFDRLDECCELLEELNISAKRHHPSMHIYRYRKVTSDLRQKIRELSTIESLLQLEVKDADPVTGEYVWSADIQGCTLESNGIIETLWPPRRFSLESVVTINWPKWPELILQRRLGYWRKIIISPVSLKETPQGERIHINEN